MTNYVRVPYYQVRNDCIIAYDLIDPRPHRRNIEGLKKAYTGDVRTGTKKRLMKAIDLMLQLNPPRKIFNPIINRSYSFRFAFVTLTVSDSINRPTDVCYKKLLKPFLRRMRDKTGASYIWKVEFQKRGQTHYHLTINKFIHYSKLQRWWNYEQRKAGFLTNFALKYKHYNPPSTHVRNVKKLKDWGGYMVDYLCKKPGGEVKGKVWDCSKDLKVRRFYNIADFDIQSNLVHAVNERKVLQINNDHCTIFKHSNPKSLLPSKHLEEYKKWLKCSGTRSKGGCSKPRLKVSQVPTVVPLTRPKSL